MRIAPLLFFVACTSGGPDASSTDDGVDTDPVFEDVVGPGLGNLTYTEEELFQPIAYVDHDNGIPTSANALRFIKPLATNMAYLHNGWFFTLFASDSGFTGGGLLFYDVSDPRSPVLLNRVFQLFADGRDEVAIDGLDPYHFDGPTGQFREAHAIGFTTIGHADYAMFHTALGVQIWDLSDAMDPFPVGALDLPGVYTGDYNDVAWQLSWQGRVAYISSSERGIFIVDTEDPTNPFLADRGDLPNPVPTGELGGFRIGPIFAVGNQLVVSSMDTKGGYAVLDISDPVNPTLLSAMTQGFDKFYSTCFSGNRIYGSVRGSGAAMTVHDVSDPFVIDLVNDELVIDEQLYCGTQDHFVFQGNEHDFAKIDVSNPNEYTVVGTGDLKRPNADHGQMSPYGNLLFVGNDHGTGSAFIPHQLEPDTTPPVVTMVSPEDGAVHVAATSRVGLTFSDAIDNLSVSTDSIELRPVDGDVVPGRFALQGQIVNFAPDAPLASGVYEVRIMAGGVTDWAGNPIEEAFTSTFEVTDLSADDSGRLMVALSSSGPVEQGGVATFTADVTGPGPVELAWRFGETEDWTEFSGETTASFAFDEPGHINVLVQATNGAQRAVDSVLFTVHRPLPGGPVASSSAISVNGDLIWVANRDNDTVSIIDGVTGAVVDEIAVGATPASLARFEGETWVAVQRADELVKIADSGAIARILLDRGASPCGLVSTAVGLFVTEFGSGDVVKYVGGEEVGRSKVEQGICGIGLAPDGTLYVSQVRASSGAGWVFAVDPNTLQVSQLIELPVDTTTVDAEDRSRGVPTFLQAPAISPDGTVAFLPAVQANTERGQWRDGQDLSHESAVRAVLPQIDLAAGAEVTGPRIDFNDRAGPMAAVTTPLGDFVFVALMGSHEIAIIDAYTGATAGAINNVGTAPRSLALSDDGTRLYVHNWLDRALVVYDTSGVVNTTNFSPTLLSTTTLVQAEVLDAAVLEGKRIFYDAANPRMSRDGYISCGSCHLDGSHDGLVWDFTERGEGLRNTTDLRGRQGVGHGPVHWTANFDEIQDFENDIRGGFGGAGFLDDALFYDGTRSDPLGDPKGGLSAQLDALSAFVTSLSTFPNSPFRQGDGQLTAAAIRGGDVFDHLGCVACHSGQIYTDSGTDLHDVGTILESSGQRRSEPLTGFDTPTLRGLWDGTPYLHDGSVSTLIDVLTTANPADSHGVTSPLSNDALADLEQYLLQLQ